MSHVLAVDPGLSSGVFLGHYSDTEPLTRVAVWQFGGVNDEVRGVEALLQWLSFPGYYAVHGGFFDGTHIPDKQVIHGHVAKSSGLVVVAEKFTPLRGKGFSLTLDAVEPLRCEGALIAKGLMPAQFPHERWQRPDRMYFCGGTTKAEKLKLSREWLKSHDLLPTGKDVGQKDANDAVSATLHAFAYMRKINHIPTLGHYFKEEK